MEKNTMAATAGKPIRCRAAVCRGPGQPLKIEEVEVDPPKASEVRLKIICTSLCHTDISIWRLKEFPGVFPRILGHEAVGIVESVGAGVEEVEEGDLVVPFLMGSCGECKDCRSEKSNMCAVGFQVLPGMSDGTTRFTGAGGEVINNFFGLSTFAEYTVVAGINVTKIDPSMPPQLACLLGCGVSTGVGAAWKVAAVEKGSTVAIFGLGAVGMAVAEGARLRGASKIIGVDLNSDKFVIGKKFGFTDFINPRDIGDERPISEVIKEMTDEGADYCFECIGLASTMMDAFESSRKGWGKTIVLGVEMGIAPLCMKPFEMLSGRSLIGSLLGGIKAKIDIPILVKKYLDKELHLDEFITHEVGFEDINKAFDVLLQGKSLRCVIWMDP